jgi:hypothetical protein
VHGLFERGVLLLGGQKFDLESCFHIEE